MLRTLTALRFPAAFVVFLSHAPLTRNAAVALSFGYSGVGFFFLLSGFILTYNYSDAFSTRAFYVARFARIYPVHFCAMIFGVAALLIAGGFPEWNFAQPVERSTAVALQSVLLQSWFPSKYLHFGGNSPAWSLSDEAFFYALFPVALVAFKKFFRGRSMMTILLTAFALWAVFAACLSGVHASFNEWSLYVFPPVRFIDFAAGMLLGLAFLRYEKRTEGDGTLSEVAVLCALAMGVLFTVFVPQSLRFSAAMMPFSAAVIFVFALQRGAISKLLAHPWLVRLGEASYAFYLLHASIVHLTRYAHIGGIAGFSLALAISIALSLAVYAFIETPMRRYIRQLDTQSRPVPALQTP